MSGRKKRNVSNRRRSGGAPTDTPPSEPGGAGEDGNGGNENGGDGKPASVKSRLQSFKARAGGSWMNIVMILTLLFGIGLYFSYIFGDDVISYENYNIFDDNDRNYDTIKTTDEDALNEEDISDQPGLTEKMAVTERWMNRNLLFALITCVLLVSRVVVAKFGDPWPQINFLPKSEVLDGGPLAVLGLLANILFVFYIIFMTVMMTNYRTKYGFTGSLIAFSILGGILLIERLSM